MVATELAKHDHRTIREERGVRLIECAGCRDQPWHVAAFNGFGALYVIGFFAVRRDADHSYQVEVKRRK